MHKHSVPYRWYVARVAQFAGWLFQVGARRCSWIVSSTCFNNETLFCTAHIWQNICLLFSQVQPSGAWLPSQELKNLLGQKWPTLGRVVSHCLTPLNFLPSLSKAKKAGTSSCGSLPSVPFTMHQRNQKHTSHDSHDVWTNHTNRGKPAVMLCLFDSQTWSTQTLHVLHMEESIESHNPICKLRTAVIWALSHLLSIQTRLEGIPILHLINNEVTMPLSRLTTV